MDSEFITLDKAGEEEGWLQNFLKDILFWTKPVAPVCIHCDSQVTIGRAGSMMYNDKSRHIRRRHNTVRELLSSGIITVDYVKSKDNVSDPLTKGLSREGVEKTSKRMGLRPRTSQHGVCSISYAAIYSAPPPRHSETESAVMDQWFPVDAITKKTIGWSYKFQVVDKFRPRESKDQSVQFQTMIVKDESEQQVVIVLYVDDISKYERLFALFKTYVVSCAKGAEVPLLSPTKLNTVPFSVIDHLCPGVEFDLLAVVANCNVLQYTTDQSKHFRETIVIDQRWHFEFNITDTSDTITATVSEMVAETMLSLTSEQIYENVVAQLQKPSYRFPDQTPGMLAITSFTEAENPVVQALPSPTTPGETGKKQKFEPRTPVKKV
ncbi:hypothetical protein CQW23_25171 [Capsicum baccatum]|uniref:Uncharacterized protein n=1 Tax=Capsicum baccatum TaxID=33114 RepID=A0A2G2VK44_CAPBA|nr:hypothetical protein CQW23_25171 [Capsicum baccatum]